MDLATPNKFTGGGLLDPPAVLERPSEPDEHICFGFAAKDRQDSPSQSTTSTLVPESSSLANIYRFEAR